MKNNRLIYLLVIILFIWLIILSSEIFSFKKNSDENVINEYVINGISSDLTNVISRSKSSVVTINADNNILSGFVYRQNEDSVYIITAYHGVSNVNSIEVTFGSTYTEKADLIGHDIYTDLAVLRVMTPYNIEPLKLGDVVLLKQGEFVISIGTPVSIEHAGNVELGMVSDNRVTIENSITVDEEKYLYYLDVIETSSGLQAGYSGSPLINMNGEVIGMNTMSLSNNFSMAISSNEIKIIADELISTQSSIRNNLGLRGTFISEMMNYEKTNLNIALDVVDGFYISKLRENSLGFEAGIRSGDIITKINGQDIRNLNDYLLAVHADVAELSFEYIRNSETLQANVSVSHD